MPNGFPSEGTLVVNATHQQEKRGLFDDGIVFAPTQVEEADLGFDIGITNATTGATEFGFQYKALTNVISRRQFDQRRQKEDAYTLPFYPGQGATLLFNAQYPREMFYALPTITSQDQLPKTLDRTVFIDVYGLYPVIADYQQRRINQLSAVDILTGLQSFSRFYVMKKDSKRTGNPSVFLKEKREGGAYADPKYYYEIPQRYVKDWNSIEALALAGRAGTPVARQGKKAPEYRQRFEYLLAVDELITRLQSSDNSRIAEIAQDLRGVLDSSRQYQPLIEGVQVTDGSIQIGPPATDDTRTLGSLLSDVEASLTDPILVQSIIEAKESEQIDQIRNYLEEIIGEEGSPLAFEGSAHCHLLSTQL